MRLLLWLVMLGLGLTLVAESFAVNSESVREKSVSSKILCNCGCGDILAECSHVQCQRRSALKQEIAAAVRDGNTDDEILNGMAARYGSAILVVPAFQGFNTLLWIVPVGSAGLMIIGAIVIWKRRSASKDRPR
jgi:cytochrome c-type biogenesis protein CcmH/NrfF